MLQRILAPFRFVLYILKWMVSEFIKNKYAVFLGIVVGAIVGAFISWGNWPVILLCAVLGPFALWFLDLGYEGFLRLRSILLRRLNSGKQGSKVAEKLLSVESYSQAAFNLQNKDADNQSVYDDELKLWMRNQDN